MDELRGIKAHPPSTTRSGRDQEASAISPQSGAPPSVMLTGVGKRYDIVSCFAALTTVVAVDPNPLAPAQYAAQVRASAPPIDDPEYVPELARLCAEYGVGAVLPLTDLDIETLALARESEFPPTLPALVPSAEVARATYDKYEAHLLLARLGLPSPPTVLPGEADLDALDYPAMVKPRRGSGARSIHLAHDASQARFFVEYVPEPTMVQRAMEGPELSIDCLGDLSGRCLNAIPRTMLESRGGESIKGTVIDDPELVELGREVMEALGVRGPATIQVFRDPRLGIRITDVNTRFGGAFPAPALAALPGRSYPELIVRMAAGEPVAPHVGEYRRDVTFTRYYWQLELNAQLQPTGKDILPAGHPPPKHTMPPSYAVNPRVEDL
ncbi:MAG: ATP-grasp domain-containing protein [Solirubrobacteraceae bacterium]